MNVTQTQKAIFEVDQLNKNINLVEHRIDNLLKQLPTEDTAKESRIQRLIDEDRKHIAFLESARQNWRSIVTSA